MRQWLLHDINKKINTTDATSGAGTAYLPEHLSSSPVFSGVRVTRSLVLYVCFVDRFLSFCTFSFGLCVVCSSSIYGFWLPVNEERTGKFLWQVEHIHGHLWHRYSIAVNQVLAFLYLFFWPLCCLFFFDIRILITPLVSSNSHCVS
jgi:hypothetical protein